MFVDPRSLEKLYESNIVYKTDPPLSCNKSDDPDLILVVPTAGPISEI